MNSFSSIRSLTPLCYALPFFLLLHTVICASPLFHFCSNTAGNYTNTRNPYANNLNMLISYLTYKAPPTGFGLGSVGQGKALVNGLALCRGDVPRKDCTSCISEAGNEIRQRCPMNKGGIIWYDNCMFKYSSLKFFGTIDYENRFYMWNLQNVSNSVSFNEKTKALLTKLSAKAAEIPKLFATAEEELGASEKLYGLVQCTRDLSKEGCKRCLDAAIDELPTCCAGRRGGRVVGGSCNFRYELYPFVRSN